MTPLHEIDVMGIFVAPFAICVPLALLLAGGGLWMLRRATPGAAWARSPSLELSLLVGAISGLVLLLGRF